MPPKFSPGDQVAYISSSSGHPPIPVLIHSSHPIASSSSFYYIISRSDTGEHMEVLESRLLPLGPRFVKFALVVHKNRRGVVESFLPATRSYLVRIQETGVIVEALEDRLTERLEVGWMCEQCTFWNTEDVRRFCEMCDNEKSREELERTSGAQDAGRANGAREDAGRANGAREDAGRASGVREDAARANGAREDTVRASRAREDAGRANGAREDAVRASRAREDAERASGAREDAVRASRAREDAGRASRAREDAGRSGRAQGDAGSTPRQASAGQGARRGNSEGRVAPHDGLGAESGQMDHGKAESTGIRQTGTGNAKDPDRRSKPTGNAKLETRPEFVCPITQDVMLDPVFTMDGHTYERKAIEQWFLTKNTSPVTNLAVASKSLVPNIALRSLIQAEHGTPDPPTPPLPRPRRANRNDESNNEWTTPNIASLRAATEPFAQFDAMLNEFFGNAERFSAAHR